MSDNKLVLEVSKVNGHMLCCIILNVAILLDGRVVTWKEHQDEIDLLQIEMHNATSNTQVGLKINIKSYMSSIK